MTAVIAAKPFAAALAKVVGAIETRKGIPILACVRLEIASGRAILVATDQDVRVTTALEGYGDIGPLCVEGARLAAVLARLKDKGDVKLEYAPFELVITAGRSRFALPTLDPASFPELTTDRQTHAFTIASADLCRVFAAMAPAISDEATRYYLNGVYLDCGTLSEQGVAGYLVAVATDGHKAYARHIAAPGALAAMRGIIVPTKTCGLISKLFAGIGDLAVTVAEAGTSNRVSVVGGETTLVSKLIEGTFPDWRRVMPPRASTHSYDTKGLINALENALAAAATGSKAKAVRLTFREDETEITLRTLPGEPPAEGVDVCSHSAMDEGFSGEIGIDARYLIEMLGILDAETAELAVKGAADPLVINAATFDDRRIVIMPMRV